MKNLPLFVVFLAFLATAMPAQNALAYGAVAGFTPSPGVPGQAYAISTDDYGEIPFALRNFLLPPLARRRVQL